MFLEKLRVCGGGEGERGRKRKEMVVVEEEVNGKWVESVVLLKYVNVNFLERMFIVIMYL